MNTTLYKGLCLFVVSFLGLLWSCQPTTDQRLESPQPNDYYVVSGWGGSKSAQVFKIKAVFPDSLNFYWPMGELLFGFQGDKTMDQIRQADKKGLMYGETTLTLSRQEVAAMRRPEGNIWGKNRDTLRLLHVFR